MFEMGMNGNTIIDHSRVEILLDFCLMPKIVQAFRNLRFIHPSGKLHKR